MTSLEYRQRLLDFDRQCGDLSDTERAWRLIEHAAYLLGRAIIARREPPLVGDDSIER